MQQQLSELIYAEHIHRKRFLVENVQNNPILNDLRYRDSNHRDSIRIGMKKQIEMIRLMNKLQVTNAMDRFYMESSLGHSLPLEVHFSMYIPTVVAQMEDERMQRKWSSSKVVGTYAQTELGHGSNVAKLETTATYCKVRKGFYIHSPSVSSYKWWPGGLAYSANVAIVYARLILDEVEYGVHGFVVQLRDLKTHEVLHGISLGDVGPKLGYNAVDNGYCRFDKVFIEKGQMLDRFAKVSNVGVYRQVKGMGRMRYGTMLRVRSLLILKMAFTLAKATTIAVRYSIFRKQGGGVKDGEEVCVLWYQNQRDRLLPLLGLGFALHFVGKAMREMYFQHESALDNVNVDALSLLHANSCALKAIGSKRVADGIEACRLSCGGHGFLTSSNLPSLWKEFVAVCTYEGTYDIMLLQCSRFLVKSFWSIQQGKVKKCITESPFMDYLDSTILYQKCKVACAKDWCNRDTLLLAFKARSAQLVSVLAEHVQSSMKIDHHVTLHQALNTHMIMATKAARAHAELLLVVELFHKVSKMQDKLYEVFDQLYCLFSLNILLQHIGEFRQCDYLSDKQYVFAQEAYATLLDGVVYDHAKVLVDGWDFSDFELKSTLGCADGRVYDRMLAYAQGDSFHFDTTSHVHAIKQLCKL